MVLPTSAEALYNCATECALRRKKRKCKEQWGNMACNNCNFYILNYVDADPRHAKLMQMEAGTRAAELIRLSRPDPVPYIAALLVLGIFIGGLLWVRDRDYMNRPKPYYFNTNTTTQAPQATTPSRTHTINDTLDYIAVNVRDMNNDGKVNCIDYSALFHELYPNARVIWNYNPPHMNHLFVRLNGVDIEPGAYRAPSWPLGQYHMRTIWGNKYDPSKNEDVTETYRQLWW